MTSDQIKLLAWCAFGALAGAGVGYGVVTFVVENILEAEEEELIFEEDSEDEDSIETVLSKKDKKKKEKVDYTHMYKKDENPDLARLAARYKDGSDVVDVEGPDEDEDEELEQEEDLIDHTKPYLINRDEFENSMIYKGVKLNFYDDSDVLENNADKSLITHDPEKFLGPNALTSFGTDEDDPDYVFVRNETLETDYQICVIYTPYVKPVKEVKPTKKKREVNE